MFEAFNMFCYSIRGIVISLRGDLETISWAASDLCDQQRAGGAPLRQLVRLLANAGCSQLNSIFVITVSQSFSGHRHIFFCRYLFMTWQPRKRTRRGRRKRRHAWVSALRWSRGLATISKPSRGTTRRASLAESWRSKGGGEHGPQGGQNHGIQSNLLLMLALPLGEVFNEANPLTWVSNGRCSQHTLHSVTNAAVSLIMTLVTVMPQAWLGKLFYPSPHRPQLHQLEIKNRATLVLTTLHLLHAISSVSSSFQEWVNVYHTKL